MAWWIGGLGVLIIRAFYTSNLSILLSLDPIEKFVVVGGGDSS